MGHSNILGKVAIQQLIVRYERNIFFVLLFKKVSKSVFQRCLETIFKNTNCWPTWWGWKLSEQRCSSCNCVSFPKPTGAQAHCAWYPEAELFPYATSIIAGLVNHRVQQLKKQRKLMKTSTFDGPRSKVWQQVSFCSSQLCLRLKVLIFTIKKKTEKHKLQISMYGVCWTWDYTFKKMCLHYWPCLGFILLCVASEKNLPDLMTSVTSCAFTPRCHSNAHSCACFAGAWHINDQKHLCHHHYWWLVGQKLPMSL